MLFKTLNSTSQKLSANTIIVWKVSLTKQSYQVKIQSQNTDTDTSKNLKRNGKKYFHSGTLDNRGCCLRKKKY